MSEKLIITVTYSDECTYSFEDHIPVEYEGLEEFFCLLDDAAQKLVDEANSGDSSLRSSVQVGPVWIRRDCLIRRENIDSSKSKRIKYKWVKDLPEVQKLDEWFEQQQKRFMQEESV